MRGYERANVGSRGRRRGPTPGSRRYVSQFGRYFRSHAERTWRDMESERVFYEWLYRPDAQLWPL